MKMVNEGRGISEINKIETEKIFNLFKKSGFKSNISYKILKNNILINFIEGNYNSYFFKNKQIIILNFSIPEKYNDIKLKTVITHELNHFIEIFNIENKKYRIPNYNKIKKSLLIFNPKTKPLDFFKHLLYKTLDNEINANVAQTYTYLRNFNSIDSNLLKNELEKYSLRKEYNDILNFNINKLINDISIDELQELNDIFIKHNVNDFFPFINNIEPIEKYIKNWFKIITSNVKKLLKKQENIIKEVIEDINDINNYSSDDKITESNILNYNKYLQKLKS